MNWLKFLFADFEKGNMSNVFGSNNTNIQGVENSSITIGNDIEAIVDALKEDRTTLINIFIICHFSIIEDILNWNPFTNDAKASNIKTMLESSSKKVEVKFRLFVLNTNVENSISDEEIAYLKYLKNRSILIVSDTCVESTFNNKTREFLSAYNDFQIGGCIFFRDARSIINRSLNHLLIYNSNEELHDIIDSKASKLNKRVSSSIELINAICELSKELGAAESRFRINEKTLPLSGFFKETTI